MEFALVFPLFFMLVLAMFTGGVAYNAKLSLAEAGREGARYGATLPLAPARPVADWLAEVAMVTEGSAGGELGAGVAGRYVCVALFDGTGAPATRRVEDGATPPAVLAEPCFADSRPPFEPRVQVVVRRQRTLEALVFTRDLTLQ
ncbi:MAG: TadE family protein, partial [Acidimicrobiales bacterium]